MRRLKALLSRLAVGVGIALVAVLALPTAIGVGLICLVRTGVDCLTTSLEH